MRIISGKCRRLRLASVPGRTVRPASDRLREAIFNILAERVVDARVIDLFSGIGSLGLEALSRGAASCEFVEQDRQVYGALAENIQRLGFADRAACRRTSVYPWMRSQSADARWDLAFVDPPYGLYRHADTNDQVEALFDWVGRRLTPGGTLVASSPTDRPCPPLPACLTEEQPRRYGQTWVVFWRAPDRPAPTSDEES